MIATSPYIPDIIPPLGEPKRKRVYVAGPMTGYENYNHSGFMRAKLILEAEGYDVVTPFDANSRVWQRYHGRPFDPFKDRCDYGDLILKEMLLEDLTEVKNADLVVVLQNWERSRGAGIEVQVAQAMGVPVHDFWLRPITKKAVVTWQ
jgi:nucleoside 2-deoxyribosyltransferase